MFLLAFQGGVNSLVSNIQGVQEMWYGRLIYEGVINLRSSSLALHIGFDLFLEFRCWIAQVIYHILPLFLFKFNYWMWYLLTWTMSMSIDLNNTSKIAINQAFSISQAFDFAASSSLMNYWWFICQLLMNINKGDCWNQHISMYISSDCQLLLLSPIGYIYCL